MKKIILTITLLVSSISQADTAHDHGAYGVGLTLSTSFWPAALLCSDSHDEAEVLLCVSTSAYTTAATYVTLSILIIAEKVVLERGTDGLLNADADGYVDDVVLLEALDIIREVKPDKTESMTDVQVIKLVQKEKENKVGTND